MHETINTSIFENTRHIKEYDTPENSKSILKEYIPPYIPI